jgi:hypothetical protein
MAKNVQAYKHIKFSNGNLDTISFIWSMISEDMGKVNDHGMANYRINDRSGKVNDHCETFVQADDLDLFFDGDDIFGDIIE